MTNNCGDQGTSTPAGVGVYLKNTSSPALNSMSFPGTFGNFGILGYSVDGFTLAQTTMTGIYGDNVNQDEDTVHFCTLTGTASLSGDTISNGAEYEPARRQCVGDFEPAHVAEQHDRAESDGRRRRHAVRGRRRHVQRDGPGHDVPGLPRVTLPGGAAGRRDDGSRLRLARERQHLHNTHGNIVPFAQNLNVAAGGTLTFDINSNHFDSAAAVQAQGGVFINAANSTANASGYFRNNTIGNAGVANSGSSGNDPGLDVESNGGGDLTIVVNNNTMLQWGANGAGFLLQVGATVGSPTSVNATVTNNTIAEPGTFAVNNTAQGFQLNNGTNSSENTRPASGSRATSSTRPAREPAATCACASGSTRRCSCRATPVPRTARAARRRSSATSRA